MSRIVLFALLAMGVAACGGPKCEDAAMEAQFLNGCLASGGASLAQCTCGWAELVDRYECTRFSDASLSVFEEIATICQDGQRKLDAASLLKSVQM